MISLTRTVHYHIPSIERIGQQVFIKLTTEIDLIIQLNEKFGDKKKINSETRDLFNFHPQTQLILFSATILNDIITIPPTNSPEMPDR